MKYGNEIDKPHLQLTIDLKLLIVRKYIRNRIKK